MLTIAKTAKDPQVWIGNGVIRRRVANLHTLNNLAHNARTGRLSIYKGGEVQIIEDLWSLGHPIDVDFDIVRAEVEAASKRNLAETSAAYHQLSALASGQASGAGDVVGLAGELAELLGPQLSDSFLDAFAARLNGPAA